MKKTDINHPKDQLLWGVLIIAAFFNISNLIMYFTTHPRHKAEVTEFLIEMPELKPGQRTTHSPEKENVLFDHNPKWESFNG